MHVCIGLDFNKEFRVSLFQQSIAIISFNSPQYSALAVLTNICNSQQEE